MAPLADPPESFYLPPLDKCLNGSHKLISWKSASEALSNPDLLKRSPNLEWFLLDDLSIHALASDFDPLRAPSTQSKSEFETRTAEINVTPSSNGHVDTKQIKEDALWLSKQTDLDEVSALRIVILEWQNRSATRILESRSEEEFISLTQAVGVADYTANSSSLWPNQSGKDVSKQSFLADDTRHARLLLLVLSEQEHFLEVSLILKVSSGLGTPMPPPGRSYDVGRKDLPIPWLSKVMEQVKSTAGTNGGRVPQNSQSREFVMDGIKALEKMLAGWEAGSQWSASLEDPIPFDLQYRDSQLRQIILVLELISTGIAALDSSPPAGAVQSWFEFVDRCGFFEMLQAQSPSQVQLVGPLQALVSLLSLQLLRLPYTIAYLHDQSSLDRPPPIIHDAACRAQVDETISRAVVGKSSIASPAIFAWSMILQTLRARVNFAIEDSISDDDTSLTENGSPSLPRRPSAMVPSAFVDALESIVQDGYGDTITLYAKTAVDEGAVFTVLSLLSRVLGSQLGPSYNQAFCLHARLTLLELARQALFYVDYKAELLECVLAILEGDTEIEEDFSFSTRTDLATIFMNDNEILVPRLLHQAYGRYPYELTPLLKLCRALVRYSIPKANEVPIAQPLCDPTPYFTQQLPRGFNEYELVREDENANGVKLTEDLPLISHRRSRKTARTGQSSPNVVSVRHSNEEQGDFCIPSGTTGTVISESKPFVIAWDHLHSPLRYLACLLSTTTASSDRTDVFSESPLDADSQADIISIFAKLLEASSTENANGKIPDPSESRAMWVLEEASDLLDRNQDVVSVVFEIFEKELSQHTQKRSDGTLMTLTSCIEFFRAALKVVPGRIWPLLARSELLELNSRGGRIAAVISAELSIGGYSFVNACLSLLAALRRDVVSQAVSGKIPSSAVTTRFGKPDDSSPRLPKKMVGEIIFSFVHTLTGVLKSLPDRPFKSDGLKPALTSKIICIFSDIILDVYGHDDRHEPADKLCGSLAPAAKHLLDSFFASTDDNALTTALISNLLPINLSGNQALTTSGSQNERFCVDIILGFLTTLLDVSALLDTPISHLEQQLFRTLPLFVRLYSAAESNKSSIVVLFSSLIYKAGISDSKPTSLLGHLGLDNAQCFLAELRNLSGPLGDSNQEVRTWNLASAVVQHRQRWLASFLITGDTPKNSMKRRPDNEPKTTQPKTLLATALNYISKTCPIHGNRSLAMLRFVSHAQNYWPWVTHSIQKHPDFLARIIGYAASLTDDLSKVELDETNQTYAAALIAGILAMYLHNMRQLGDASLMATLVPSLGFYRENAVSVPNFNSSLHSNLRRNIEKKFPGCDLSDFKRLVGNSTFGRNYCYDLDFASQVLGYHQVWKGPKDRGFEDEIARANTNLSLVESQVTLLGSWKSLCVELCHNIAGDKILQKHMVNVVNHCLVANIESNLPEAIFEHLLQARAELALVVLQRLVAVQAEVPSIKTLLNSVWDAIRASGQNFEIAFVGNLVPYYRTLLRILLMALRPHAYIDPSNTSSDQSNSSSELLREARERAFPVLLEIATEVAAKGFRSLCAQVHEDGAAVSPADFGLVTGVLQGILAVRGISEALGQLTLRICDTGIHRFALALFSWSDRLTSGDESDDPVFGELSISFLRELSSMPPMAEFLATEGIIAQISTAAILSRLRSSSPVHFASHLRLLQIWSGGVLPLTLNVLAAVGDPVAPEALAFLNSFPEQLQRASASLTTAGASPSKSNPLAGSITLPSATELHTLGMMSCVFDVYRESPTAAAVAASGASFPQELKWDRAGIKEDVEAWLQGSQAALRDKIAPTTEREFELQRSPPLGTDNGGEEGCENRLEEYVVRELKGTLRCLGAE